MPSSSNRLPSRFPVGTKFVIEGRRGGEGQVQVFSRYLEFPDGTFFPLPTHPVQRRDYPTVRQVARSQALGHWPRPNASKPLWANGKSRVGHWPTCDFPLLKRRKPRPPVGQGFRAIGQSPLKVALSHVSRRRWDNAEAPPEFQEQRLLFGGIAMIAADTGVIAPGHDLRPATLRPEQDRRGGSSLFARKNRGWRGYPPTSGP